MSELHFDYQGNAPIVSQMISINHVTGLAAELKHLRARDRFVHGQVTMGAQRHDDLRTLVARLIYAVAFLAAVVLLLGLHAGGVL